MAVELRRKLRGPTALLDTMTGSEGLLAMDRGRVELRLFDGVKLGGFRILTKDNADGVYPQKTTTVTGTNGISGGGDLSSNRVLQLAGQAKALHEFDKVGLLFRAAAADIRQVIPGYGLEIGLDPTPGATNLLVAADLSEVVSTTRNINTTSPLTGGGNLLSDRTLGINAALVPVSRSLAAGDGLTGGGNLAASGGGSLSIAIDKTKVPYDRSFVFGNGLTGTSALLAGNGGSISTQVDRYWVLSGIGIGTGLVASALSNTPNASFTIGLSPTYQIPTSRTLTAGNGLTGGGDLSANRTVALGTPSDITATSTNSVTSTSHTHAVDQAMPRYLIAAEATAGHNRIGMHAFLKCTSSIMPGDIVLESGGNGLRYSGTDLINGASAQGKWKALGRCAANEATLFIRIE